jgi:hypothetical protein
LICGNLSLSDGREAEEMKEALLQQPDRPDSLMEGQAGLACFLGTLLEIESSADPLSALTRCNDAASPWLM